MSQRNISWAQREKVSNLLSCLKDVFCDNDLRDKLTDEFELDRRNKLYESVSRVRNDLELFLADRDQDNDFVVAEAEARLWSDLSKL